MKNQTQLRIRNLISLYVIIYMTMLMFGIIETVKSVTLPAIKLSFGINYTETGGMISFVWFGYVFLCFIVTLVLQKIGIKKSLFIGYLLVVFGCTMTIFTSSYFSVLIALFVVNTSFGFFEVGSNALAMKIFTKKTALLMSLMHFFYGLGAVIGPYLGSNIMNSPYFIEYGLGAWRVVYIILSIPVLLFSIYIAFTKFDYQNKSDPDKTSKIETLSTDLTFFKVIKMPVVWIFISMLGLMEVIEFGAVNWGPFYLKDVFNWDPNTKGAVFVSTFYFLFTASRLLGGFAVEKIGYYQSLVICLVMTILLYTLGFLLGIDGVIILTFGGIFIAQFWIITLSIAEKKFKQEAPIITSVIITMSGFIMGIFQIIIGYINEHIGYAWGYRSCLLYAGIVLGIALIFRKQINIKCDE